MSESEAIRLDPAELWTAELALNIIHPPLVLGNTLLVAVKESGHAIQGCSLIALDLGTGEKRWQYDFAYALVNGLQPDRVLSDRREVAIVATSSSDLMRGEGAVLAIDAHGEIAWQWRASEQSYSAPVVAEHQVYVTAGTKSLVAVCPEDGGRCDEQRIQLEVRASLAAPAISNGVAFIPSRGPELLAVGLDGHVRWHLKLKGANREWLDKTPVIDDGSLFSASSLGFLLAVDIATGTMMWRTEVGEGRPLSDPVISGDRVFVGSRIGVSAVDKASGRIIWSHATTRPVSAAPAVVNSTLYFTSEDHHAYAVDAEGGAERWRHEMPRRIEVPPILAAGKLIIADRGGNITAFEMPEAPATVIERSDQGPAALIAFRRQSAEKFEGQGESLEAARLWLEIGELERAAEQFEVAEAWLQAAELWQQMDRYGKKAQALRRYARALSNEEAEDEEKAIAWEKAARAYAETGQKEIRLQCEREVARYRQQPIISLEVEAADLIVNAWSKLNYSVRNDGFGVARHVDVTLKGDQFEGQIARTQTIITLQPGQSYSHWIDVSPRSHGTSVPMHLAVEYIDKAGKVHVLDRTQYLPVFAATSPLTTGGGSLYGDVGDTAGLFSRLPSAGNHSLPELREKMVQLFSREELGDLIFQLGLIEDDFDEKISVMAKELILLMVRHDRMPELIAKLQEVRPTVEW